MTNMQPTTGAQPDTHPPQRDNPNPVRPYSTDDNDPALRYDTNRAGPDPARPPGSAAVPLPAPTPAGR